MEDFETLFRSYFSRVYRFALRLTHSEDQAEELTQQTFFKAFKQIDRFEGRSDPTTWLCSIAKNTWFDEHRKHRTDAYAPESPVFDQTDSGVEEDVLWRWETMRAHRQLHALKEPYREVFTLRVFGELKYGQIAGLFGKSENWARVTYYRAKQMLIERMEEEEHEQD